jgi:regulatory protein YycI of two-component signal transduction system YycFG
MVAAINMVVLQTRNYIHEAKMSERNDTQSAYQQKRLSDYRGWNGCVFGFYALKNLNSEYIFNIVAEREKMVHSNLLKISLLESHQD